MCFNIGAGQERLANQSQMSSEQMLKLITDMVTQFGTPALQQQLQTTLGMQGPVASAQGTLGGLLSNANTFATPDWQNPFSPQEKATLMQLGSMNTNDMTSKLGQAQQTNLNQRGIGNSSAGNALAPNLELFRQSELAKNSANLLNAELTRGDALRNEGKQTASGLWGLANYQVPGGTVGSYLPTLQQLMAAQQEAAGRYGANAAAQNAAFGQLIGTLGGAAAGTGFGAKW